MSFYFAIMFANRLYSYLSNQVYLPVTPEIQVTLNECLTIFILNTAYITITGIGFKAVGQWAAGFSLVARACSAHSVSVAHEENRSVE
jgi:hypothetical protein